MEIIYCIVSVEKKGGKANMIHSNQGKVCKLSLTDPERSQRLRTREYLTDICIRLRQLEEILLLVMVDRDNTADHRFVCGNVRATIEYCRNRLEEISGEEARF